MEAAVCVAPTKDKVQRASAGRGMLLLHVRS